MKVSPWILCKTYEEAEDLSRCLYVFCKNNVPVYVGRAKIFGGKKGRYSYGFRYLIDLLLQSEYKLYVAELTIPQYSKIRDYEDTLIYKFDSDKLVNRRKLTTDD